MSRATTSAADIVYVIGSTETRLVKIGTTDDAPKRLSDIQRMGPLPLKVLWFTPGDYVLEFALHRRFAPFRKHGEWFDFGEADAVAEVSAAVDEIRTMPANVEVVGLPGREGRPRTGVTPVRTLRMPNDEWADLGFIAAQESSGRTEILRSLAQQHIEAWRRKYPDITLPSDMQ